MSKDNFRPSKKHYDVFAPKFKYVRDFYGFTRKTSRVKKSDHPIIGLELGVDSKPRGDNMFPWTRPMKGWKRVSVGQGRWVTRGRHKRSKSKGSFTSLKPHKKPFIESPLTYQWRSKW